MALIKRRRAIDARAAGLGRLLLERRERVGLTRSELARRLGISVETVSAVEAGRPPRHSTLLAYLRALPGLEAHQLLGVEPRHAPQHRSSIARTEAAVVGMRADRIVLSESGVEVRGLRALEADARDPAVLLLLKMAACVGSNSLLRRIESDTTCLEENAGRHEWRGRGRAVDYRFEGLVEWPFLLDLPAKRLELRCSRREESSVRIANPVGGDEEITDDLYPDGLTLRGGRVVLNDPLTHLSYGLMVPLGPPRRPLTTGARLAEARHSAGLSLHELAGTTGLSSSVLWRFENGADCSWSTLRTLLEALPELRPQELLALEAGSLEELSSGELIAYRSVLHGLVADSVEKRVEYDARGHRRTVIETAGLRPRRASLRNPVVRFQALRAAVPDAPSVLQEIVASEPATTMRRLQAAASSKRSSWELRFPARARTDGIYLRRVLRSERRTPLDAETARSIFGGSPPWVNGAAVLSAHPVRRLRLELTFPSGYAPLRPRAGAWPLGVLADPEHPALSAAQRPSLIRIRGQDGRLTLSIEVKGPSQHLRYGIGWEVE